MAMNLNLIPTPRLEAEPEQPQGLLGRIGRKFV
jgi:hypothetical protein